MILQTGQRTDIPAFYAPWFINRLREGIVRVRNPYHPFQVTEYQFSPETIDCIAFTSKNPTPLWKYHEELSAYRQYWHITITPYGKEIEPYVPPKERIIDVFQKISQTLGKKFIVWRYDPIIVTDTYTLDFHLQTFYQMAMQLRGFTQTVVMSFIDLYPKVVRNWPGIQRPSIDCQRILMKELIHIAHSMGMNVKTCGEQARFKDLGADTSGCFTKEEFEDIYGGQFILPPKQAARPNCACYLHGDIGVYDTCHHLCRYCYANTNPERVNQVTKHHSPESPFLICQAHPQDQIHVVKAQLWRQPRPPQSLSLFE